MATRVVRDSHDEVRRQFWFVVAAYLVTLLGFAGIVYAFDAMVH